MKYINVSDDRRRKMIVVLNATFNNRSVILWQ
jgi:hypothetical protein